MVKEEEEEEEEVLEMLKLSQRAADTEQISCGDINLSGRNKYNLIKFRSEEGRVWK
jgi:hypothetical protein